MKSAKLDVSLKDFAIGLSGAIPEREAWSEPAMDRGILEFIALLSGLVFKYGGRVVHGSHPSFTPIILRQARLHSTRKDHPPVTLVMSDLWFEGYHRDEIDAMTDVAELVVTKKVGNGTAADTQTRNDSLRAMRSVLVSAQNIMVAVGGKMHTMGGANPGVAEEMIFAEKQGIPRFLIGGLGGYARQLTAKLMPDSLQNGLSQEENEELFATADVSASVNIVFENLCHRYWTHKSSNLKQPNLTDVEGLIRMTVSRKSD